MLERLGLVDVAAVGAQERVVGTAGHQHAAPPGRVGRGRDGAQQAGGHVDPFEAPADGEEPPAVVVQQHRVVEPADQGDAVAHPLEEQVRARACGPPRTWLSSSW